MTPPANPQQPARPTTADDHYQASRNLLDTPNPDTENVQLALVYAVQALYLTVSRISALMKGPT